MKRWIVCGSLWLALFGVGFGLSQAANYESYSGFTVAETPVLPSREIHPQIWFGKGESAGIFQRRNADGYSKRLWQGIEAKIANYKELPFPAIPAKPGKDLERYYGTMSKSVRYLAFAWVMTADETARDKAIVGLLRAFDGPIYTLDPREKDNGVDEIYIATWLQNYCAAYDWVYEQLTPDQNQEIRNRLVKMGRWFHENIDVWGPRPHNHRSKPAWALGSLALTLSGEPEAKAWLAHALKSANTNTKYFFSNDGIYREGSHYLIYSLVNCVPFLYHYQNVSGVNQFPTYQPVFDWMLKVRNGKGWLPNLEDAYNKPTPLQMVAKQYLNVTSPLHPRAKVGNLYQWSFFNSDLGPWQTKDGGYSYTGASIDDSWDLDEYLTYDPTIQPIAPTGSPLVFMDQGGQTVFRNNWLYNDPSTRYLLFHGVAEADNHNHEDQLSFIIQAENQMMASDCGYSTGSYGDKERVNWYLKAEAHNIVTCNGEYPKDGAENVTPPSRYNIATGFCGFQEKEAYYPKNNGTIRRAIAFPGLDYFVVADQLSGSGDYTLYLHGGRGALTGQGNFRIWEYQTDDYGNAARMAVWTLPGQAKLTIDQGAVTYVRGDATKYPYLMAKQSGKDPLFMQIIVPLAINAKIPVLTDLSTPDYVAARVQKESNRDYYLLQQTNRTVKTAGIQTDATFGWIRTDGAVAGEPVTQWQLRQGTMLQVNGQTLYAASLPVSLALSYTPNAITGAIGLGAPATGYRVKLAVPKGKTVTACQYNGRAIQSTVTAGMVDLELRGFGELAITFK